MYAENEKPNAGYYIKQGGPSMARGTKCSATDGPRGTVCSATDGPGGPSVVPRMVQGDQLFGGPTIA